ncbi:MAG: PH domain-containing protein [Ornithinimicrobium sp.]
MSRTYRVDRPQQRKFAIAAFAVQLLMLAVMIALIVWRDAGSWILTVVIAASLLPTLFAWQQTRMCTTISDGGVDVFDSFRTHHHPWEELTAVGRHERYDHLVAMRHTDGGDVVLPGVHASDVAELRVILTQQRSAR